MRLLARSRRRRRDGTRTLRAGIAWRRLTRAGERGDQAAVNRLWAAWLAGGDPELWALLSRWRRPAGGSEDSYRLSLVALGEFPSGDPAFHPVLAEAAGRDGHPIAEAARHRILTDGQTDGQTGGDQALVDAVCAAALQERIGRRPNPLMGFCVRHGLAPADPARRAMFYLLTGQPEQHRALDPDGSLLTVGYNSATSREQERLRAAMVGAGEVDLLRVVAGGSHRERVARMTPDEVDYLTTQLAGRRAWEELWRLLRDLTPVAAVRAARLLDEHWQPPDDRDRALLEALRGFDPETVAAARADLAAPLDLPSPGDVVAGAFSRDGRRLAMATVEEAVGRVGVVDLADLSLVAEFDLGERKPVCMLHTRTGIVVGTSDALLWCAEGQVTRRDNRPPGAESLAPRFVRRRGFVALAGDGVHFLSESGAWVGVEKHHHSLRWNGGGRWVAAEPGSGQLGVASESGIRIVDGRHAQRTFTPAWRPMSGGSFTGVCFAGPDTLVTSGKNDAPGRGGVRRWRRAGRRLELDARADLPVPVRDPVPIPYRGEIAVLAKGRVHYLDAATLERVQGPRELDGAGGERLWAAPSGGAHALTSPYRIVVVLGERAARVTAVADRPLATADLSDLRVVAAARRDPVLRARAGPLIDLLGVCLRHRFATDVGLGEVERLLAAETDVYLSVVGLSEVGAPDHGP